MTAEKRRLIRNLRERIETSDASAMMTEKPLTFSDALDLLGSDYTDDRHEK